MRTGQPARSRRAYGRVFVSRARLIEVLSRHRGEAAAITASDLAIILGCTERDNRSLREAINELIRDGWCIGSRAFAEGGGYFIVQTTDELARVTAQLRGRAAETIRHADALEAAFRTGPRQPGLFGGVPTPTLPDEVPCRRPTTEPAVTTVPAASTGPNADQVRAFIRELETKNSRGRTPS